MKLSTELLLLTCGSVLLLSGCGPATESKGLCSYLGGCMPAECEEGEDTEDGCIPAAAPAPVHSTGHDTSDHSGDHGASGQDDQ